MNSKLWGLILGFIMVFNKTWLIRLTMAKTCVGFW
jgi:hypothetical protein